MLPSRIELCCWREKTSVYIACAKSRQAVSPPGMESRKSSPLLGMIKGSFLGILAKYKGWGEPLQVGRRKAEHLAEKSTEWRTVLKEQCWV